MFVCVWMCVDNVCAGDSTNNSIRLQLPYEHTKLVCNKNNTYPHLPEDFIAQIALNSRGRDCISALQPTTNQENIIYINKA